MWWSKKNKTDSYTLENLKLVLQEDREQYKNNVVRTHLQNIHIEKDLEAKTNENVLLKTQLEEKNKEIDKLFHLLNESMKENERLVIKITQKPKEINYSKEFKELKCLLVKKQKVLTNGATTNESNVLKPIKTMKLISFVDFEKGLTEGQRDLLSLLIKCKSQTIYNVIREQFVKLGYNESSVGGFLEKLKKKGLEQFIQIVKEDNRVSFKVYDGNYKLSIKEKKEKVGKKKEKKLIKNIHKKKFISKKKKVSPITSSKKKKINIKTTNREPISKLAKLKSRIIVQANA